MCLCVCVFLPFFLLIPPTVVIGFPRMGGPTFGPLGYLPDDLTDLSVDLTDDLTYDLTN